MTKEVFGDGVEKGSIVTIAISANGSITAVLRFQILASPTESGLETWIVTVTVTVTVIVLGILIVEATKGIGELANGDQVGSQSLAGLDFFRDRLHLISRLLVLLLH